MRNDYSSKYLSHHGILGQRKGVKNGPPYPLGAGDHSATEKKAGWRKSLSGDGEETKRQKKKRQKDFAKQMKASYKKDTPSWSNDEKEKNVEKAISPEQQKEIKAAFKEWEDAYIKEEDFWESKEYKQAGADAYDETLKWYKKNEPDQLKEMIKDNNGDSNTLARYHDFRKMYEGYDDEFTSKAQVKYFKEHNIDPDEERAAFARWQNKVDDITDQLVGKYGNEPLGKKATQIGYDTIRKYTRSGVVSLSRNYL